MAIPVAKIVASVIEGPAPLEVTFRDESTGPPTAWLWDFSSNHETDSTARNVRYIFPRAGNFTVKLIVSNAEGSSFDTQRITVSAPVSATGYTPPHGAAVSADF